MSSRYFTSGICFQFHLNFNACVSDSVYARQITMNMSVWAPENSNSAENIPKSYAVLRAAIFRSLGRCWEREILDVPFWLNYARAEPRLHARFNSKSVSRDAFPCLADYHMKGNSLCLCVSSGTSRKVVFQAKRQKFCYWSPDDELSFCKNVKIDGKFACSNWQRCQPPSLA